MKHQQGVHPLWKSDRGKSMWLRWLSGRVGIVAEGGVGVGAVLAGWRVEMQRLGCLWVGWLNGLVGMQLEWVRGLQGRADGVVWPWVMLEAQPCVAKEVQEGRGGWLYCAETAAA